MTVVITSASLITIIFGVVFEAEVSKHRKKQCEHEFEFELVGAHSHSHFTLDLTFLVFKNVSMPVNIVDEIFLEIDKNDDFVLHSLVDCIWLGIYLFNARASFPKTSPVLSQAAPWSAYLQIGSLDNLSPFSIHSQNIGLLVHMLCDNILCPDAIANARSCQRERIYERYEKN